VVREVYRVLQVAGEGSAPEFQSTGASRLEPRKNYLRKTGG